MSLNEKARSLLEKMRAEIDTSGGGIYFDWRKFNCSGMDSPTKIYLLELIYRDWKNLEERKKTGSISEFGNFDENYYLQLGQIDQLFNLILKVPEIDP